jgi:hypothetical protein
VTFDSSGGWKRQKPKIIAKGNQILIALDKCLTKTPVVKMKILKTVYEMLSKYTIEIFGLKLRMEIN